MQINDIVRHRKVTNARQFVVTQVDLVDRLPQIRLLGEGTRWFYADDFEVVMAFGRPTPPLKPAQAKPVEPGGGMKFDTGKPDYRDMLDPLLLGCLEGIQGVVAVLKMGARKYAANSWQKLENAEARYTQALLRHLASIQEHGLLHVDEESNLLSIYHVCCDALFLACFATKRAKAQAEKESS